MILRKAREYEVAVVAQLYRSGAMTEHSVWDENYPTSEHARNDYLQGNLFVYEDNGNIIGAASVESDHEFDDMEFWEIKGENAVEIARIIIAPYFQGRGLGAEMVVLLIKHLAGNGIKAVHLLSAKSNIPATKTYSRLGFKIVGECLAFGHEYYAMEYIV